MQKKEIIIRVKEQPSERGTVFTRYTSDKELVSSIYKENTHTHTQSEY